jgi:hypothetical protein
MPNALAWLVSASKSLCVNVANGCKMRKIKRRIMSKKRIRRRIKSKSRTG